MALTDKIGLHTLISYQSAATPDAIALEDSNGLKMSFREMEAVSDALAFEIQKYGVEKGYIVPIYRHRDYRSVISMIAIMKTGAAYCPIDPMYPKDRVDYMIGNCEANFIISNAGLAQELAYEGNVLDLDSIWETLPFNGPSFPAAAVSPEDPVYVIFTSGSTGKPKGVLLHHGALVVYTPKMNDFFVNSRPGRCLAASSFSFDASVQEIYLPLTTGLTKLLMNSNRGCFFEYHTSGDNFDLLDFNLIQEFAETELEILRRLDEGKYKATPFERIAPKRVPANRYQAELENTPRDYIPSPLFKGPLFLSKAGLYVDINDNHILNAAIDKIMINLNGVNSCADIAQKCGLDFDLVDKYLRRFQAKNLITIKPIGQNN